MATTHQTKAPSRVVQIKLASPIVIENSDASFRPPSGATVSDGTSHNTSSREKAYRRLVSYSTTGPLFHVDLLKTPPNMMNEKTLKKMPVVKLKVGEIVPSIKRSHTIAEMNNLRSNFGNYSHYRMDSGEKQLPSLSVSSHGSSSHGDNTLLFVLRGMTGSKSPKSVESQTSVSARSPASSKTSRSPLFKRTFKLVKSSDRMGDISTPSLHQVNGYEIRGSSLFKGNQRNEDKTVAHVSNKRSAKKSSASLPSRPTSYLTSRQCTPSQSRDYSAFDKGEGYLDEALVTRTPKTTRRVHFDESKRLANIKYVQDRINENHTRHTSGKSSTPLQLTIKNLEMFEYLSISRKEIDRQQQEHLENIPNPRVLSWVQNTAPISDIPEEPELDTFRDNADDVSSKTNTNDQDSGSK